MQRLRNKWFLFLGVAAILGIVVRFYHIKYPVADWHSWRQADTAAVARNFLKFGIDPSRPRYDDLSNIQSGKDNPNGWRMVEFPIYQLVSVYLYKAVPRFPIEFWLRVVSIVSTGGSILLLGYLLVEIVSPLAGVFGAFLYAFLPFSIYYGRAILPDPFGTFCALLSLALLWKSGNKGQSWFYLIMGAVAGGISVLVRPMEIFVLTPGVYLLIRNKSVKD